MDKKIQNEYAKWLGKFAWTHMVTLTHWRNVDPYYFDAYFRSVSQRLNIDGFSYAMSVERHKDAQWHSHGIIACDDPYRQNIRIRPSKGWRGRLHRLDSGMIPGIEWALKRVHIPAYAIALDWRVTRGGISDVQQIRDREAAIGYALKYALKYVETGEWFCGNFPIER